MQVLKFYNGSTYISIGFIDKHQILGKISQSNWEELCWGPKCTGSMFDKPSVKASSTHTHKQKKKGKPEAQTHSRREILPIRYFATHTYENVSLFNRQTYRGISKPLGNKFTM